MLEYLHLKNVGPAPELELELAPRLNLLTGDNGLGKSFLLDIAWWALTRRWPAEANRKLLTGRMARPLTEELSTIEWVLRNGVGPEVNHAEFDRAGQKWSRDSGKQGAGRLILYGMPDGSFAIYDSARGNSGSPGAGLLVFSPAEVWDGLRRSSSGTPCKGLIDDWALWQTQNGEAFAQLQAVLTALSPDPHERLEPGRLTRTSIFDVRDTPTIRVPYGQEVPVTQISAGMRRIVALAYLLVWAWQEHLRASEQTGRSPGREVLFLIDEIEAHLHPRWQRTILRALLDVMERLDPGVGVQALVTTHSALVMASMEPWFDLEKDAWFDLDMAPRAHGTYAVELAKRPWVRHGDASAWLTSEAFDLGDAGSVEREQALAEAANALNSDKFSPHGARSLHERLRAVLPDTDPFWVRWRYVAEKRGWLP